MSCLPEDIAYDGTEDHLSLCETLDRVLNKGVVLGGEVLISVANVDLIYIGLQLVLASADTARGVSRPTASIGVSTGERAHD